MFTWQENRNIFDSGTINARRLYKGKKNVQTYYTNDLN